MTCTLEQFYSDLQRSFLVEPAPEFANLVVPNGNAIAPVHRWFHLKEAFSLDLLHSLIVKLGLRERRNLRVLDPYTGSGTTAIALVDGVLASELRNPVFYGLEVNPFLHLVASTKLAAMQAPPKGFSRFASKIVQDALRSIAGEPALPKLATFQRKDFFDSGDVQQLLRLSSSISKAEVEGAHPLEVALARLCLGSSVEPVSNLRRDGRTLRFSPKKSRPAPVDAFRARIANVVADLPDSKIPVAGRVFLGDGRHCAAIDGRFDGFDLVLFSPPYPNNIDYTEVYKLENWLLGFISDGQEFRRQRENTVYSHPSILRADLLPSPQLSGSANQLLESIARALQRAVPLDRYHLGRVRMLRGYILDMYLSLKSAAERINPSGWIVYVVGNSAHGRSPQQFVVAADLIMARLAVAAGLHVERIAVARIPRRRRVDSPYLRESLVFLRRR